jgi:hypothetical protein
MSCLSDEIDCGFYSASLERFVIQSRCNCIGYARFERYKNTSCLCVHHHFTKQLFSNQISKLDFLFKLTETMKFVYFIALVALVVMAAIGGQAQESGSNGQGGSGSSRAIPKDIKDYLRNHPEFKNKELKFCVGPACM